MSQIIQLQSDKQIMKMSKIVEGKKVWKNIKIESHTENSIELKIR
jgi:hypothetical protein